MNLLLSELPIFFLLKTKLVKHAEKGTTKLHDEIDFYERALLRPTLYYSRKR